MNDSLLGANPEYYVLSNSSELSPGIGFNCIEKKPTKWSLVQSEESLSHKTICDLIQKRVTSFNSQKSKFELLNNQFVSVHLINGLDELNTFLGERKLTTLNRLFNAKENDFVPSTVFSTDCSSFFAKISFPRGKWSLQEIPSGLSNPEVDEYLFRQKFGDSFITEVQFGSAVMFRIDVEQTQKNNAEIIRRDLEKVLRKRGETFARNQLVEKLQNQTKILQLKLLDLPESDSKITDFKVLLRYIDKLSIWASKHPEVIESKAKFYDESIVSPNLLAGYSQTINAFEANSASKTLNLYQCNQYFTQILMPQNCSDFTHNKKEAATEAKKIALQNLEIASKFIEDLKTTCWSTILPSITPAEEVVSRFTLIDSPLINISKKVSALSEPNLSQMIHIQKTKITFDTFYSLCLKVFDLISNYNGETNGIPQYVFFPCSDLQTVASLTTRQEWGHGCLMYHPKSITGVKKMLRDTDYTLENQLAFHRYMKIYLIENSSKLKMKDAVRNFSGGHEPFSPNSVNAAPRNVSRLDDHSFIFHERVGNSIESSVAQITSFIDKLSSLSMIQHQKKMRKTLQYCCRKMRNVIADLTVIAEAQAEQKISIDRLREGFDIIAYGPKVLDSFAGKSGQLRLDLLGAIRSALEEGTVPQTESMELLMVAEKTLEVEESIAKATERGLRSAIDCYNVLAEMLGELGDSEKIAGALMKMKQVEFFLYGYRNDTEARPSLRVISVVEFVHDGKDRIKEII